MLGDHRPQVHVAHGVDRAQNHVVRVVVIDEPEIHNNIAQQEPVRVVALAVHAARQHEQAVGLPAESPRLTCADVVDQRAVVERHDNAHAADAGVFHIGQRKIDQPVTAAKRHRRQRALLHLLIDPFHRIIGCN